ncbi:MAG: hypothetical protein WCO84_05595, partial [bacterium]
MEKFNQKPKELSNIENGKNQSSKEAVVLEIKKILSFKIDANNISNSEVLLDGLFNSFIVDVEYLTSKYAL